MLLAVHGQKLSTVLLSCCCTDEVLYVSALFDYAQEGLVENLCQYILIQDLAQPVNYLSMFCRETGSLADECGVQISEVMLEVAAYASIDLLICSNQV